MRGQNHATHHFSPAFGVIRPIPHIRDVGGHLDDVRHRGTLRRQDFLDLGIRISALLRKVTLIQDGSGGCILGPHAGKVNGLGGPSDGDRVGEDVLAPDAELGLFLEGTGRGLRLLGLADRRYRRYRNKKKKRLELS